MVAHYTRARTALASAAAAVGLVAGLVLQPAATQHVISPLLRIKLTSTHVLAGAQDLAVMIQLPALPASGDRVATRRPISVVLVLDRSASMHGEPLERAKHAARLLVELLDDHDSFAIVTFSDRDELIMAAGTASRDRKVAAGTAIDRIVASGGTCASCGIARGEHEILRSPDLRGVHRMVLISDGQANLGLRDRDELVALAGETAAHGVSISTVGVGLDFDEQTMIRLGETAHGNYYFAQDTGQLGAILATEVASLRRIVATHVRLRAVPAAGTTIAMAYGHPLLHREGGVVVPIADLGAGEAKKLVLHGEITAPVVGTFELQWTDPVDGSAHSAHTTLATTLTTDLAQVAATRDAEATAAVEQARTAQAIERSVIVYEQAGPAAAKAAIEHYLRDEHVADSTALSAASIAVRSYDLSRDEATKATRTTAYELTR